MVGFFSRRQASAPAVTTGVPLSMARAGSTSIESDASSLKILAVLAEAETAFACLDAAEAAAHAIGGASIEALHIIVDPRSLITASEEISFQRLRQIYEGTPEERAAAVRDEFDRWKWTHPEADIPFSWKELVGGEEASLMREAESFDLLVLARAKNIDGADALHAAVFAVRHPFILVPSHWRLNSKRAFAGKVVIAWNDTRGCRRAVEGARPWLRTSQGVTALLIDEDETSTDWLEEFLKDSGVKFVVERVDANRDENLGDQIIDEAHKRKADLLVMGAYRHNQFIEWLLGSTTRHVLAHLDLPLLAVH